MPVNLDWQGWECYLLALTVWREARNQGYDCQCAVAQSILNRVKAKSWFGESISEVIGKPWQYSSMGAPGDRQLVRWPKRGDASFDLCMQVVEDVINQRAQDFAKGATHFWDDSITPPAWANTAEYKCKYGQMNFVKVP